LPGLHRELWVHAAEDFFTAFRIHGGQLAHEFVARSPLCVLAPANTDREKRGHDPNRDICPAHEKNKEAKRVSDNPSLTVQSVVTRARETCVIDRTTRSKSMYSVEIDRSKRLLVISALQQVTAEQVKLVAQRVRELLHDVAPGFRVLADFRWLESMDSGAAPHLAEIMDTLSKKRVASVTRVMPDPHKDIGLNILSQFHYGPEIQITTFETLADALQSLTEL